MPGNQRPLAIVIGATYEIGREWATFCARNNMDLILASRDPAISAMARKLQDMPIRIDAIEADLGLSQDANLLLDNIGGRPVAALLIAVDALSGKGFIEENFKGWRQSIETYVTGVLYVVQSVARLMSAQKKGLILFAGIGGKDQKAPSYAMDAGLKAFLNSFAAGLGQELKDSGVKVSVLLPGETGTQFVEGQGAPCGQHAQMKKYDPSNLTQMAFKEMMKTGTAFLAGWQKMMQSALTSIAHEGSADMRRLAERVVPIRQGYMNLNPVPGKERTTRSRHEGRDDYEESRRPRAQGSWDEEAESGEFVHNRLRDEEAGDAGGYPERRKYGERRGNYDENEELYGARSRGRYRRSYRRNGDDDDDDDDDEVRYRSSGNR